MKAFLTFLLFIGAVCKSIRYLRAIMHDTYNADEGT